MIIIRCVLLPIVLCILAVSPASAQTPPCDPSQFATLTNMWKIDPDQNTGQIPAVELAAERKVMQRVAQIFRSSFVPTGAAGYTSVNYDVLPHAITNKRRYGNTYSYFLSNHKIECRGGKPMALDVSFGNVSFQVNVHFIGEAEDGDASAGFAFLPRGYYQLKEGVALPQPNAEGIHQFNFVDGTTVWWLTRAGALPFRLVTQREFLNRQIDMAQAKSSPNAALLDYYRQMLSEATDEVAFVKQSRATGVTEPAYVFTTLEDAANRILVTVNPDYYDRSASKAAPQHILIRLRRESEAFLNRDGNGARHLESFQKLREIVLANLAEFRSMVK